MYAGFGKMLKQRRKQLHMTQRQVSEKMHLEESGNISNYERDKSHPPIELLPDLAKALDVSVGYFFGEEIDNSSDTEKNLLIAFRKLDPDKQDLAVKIIKSMSA